ncbi:MAG: hypothetical protein K2K97_01550, partial [Muribaculaceae bacterium]|nr:hypothetical protein [Muribaculaceae bacterium]
MHYLCTNFSSSPLRPLLLVLLIFYQSRTEIVICGRTRDIFLKTVKAKCPAGKEIELAFFKKRSSLHPNPSLRSIMATSLHTDAFGTPLALSNNTE